MCVCVRLYFDLGADGDRALGFGNGGRQQELHLSADQEYSDLGVTQLSVQAVEAVKSSESSWGV